MERRKHERRPGMVRAKALWGRLGPADQLAGLGGDYRFRRGRYWPQRALRRTAAATVCNHDAADHRLLSGLRPDHEGRLALALGQRRLAHRKVALLVDQAPLVKVRKHDPSRLLGQVGGARQTDLLAQLAVDLAQRLGSRLRA